MAQKLEGRHAVQKTPPQPSQVVTTRWEKTMVDELTMFMGFLLLMGSMHVPSFDSRVLEDR